MKPRQLALLRFIAAFSQEHGYAPTIREMAAGAGISSNSVVTYNLNILAREGYARKGEYAARTTVLTAKGEEALKEEVKP